MPNLNSDSLGHIFIILFSLGPEFTELLSVTAYSANNWICVSRDLSCMGPTNVCSKRVEEFLQICIYPGL